MKNVMIWITDEENTVLLAASKRVNRSKRSFCKHYTMKAAEEELNKAENVGE